MKRIVMLTVIGDGATEQKCFVCGKAVGDGWFCRIPRDGKRIVLCSPSCAMRFFENLFSAMRERTFSKQFTLRTQAF
jgi:hypothetical protein